MENSVLSELLTEHLRDVYDAEKQLTKALPKMAKAAGDEELAQGFRAHAVQTGEQVKRLEQVFQQLGAKPRGKPCAGMKGLIEEGQELMSQEEGESLDLSLTAAARKVEHYEMMAYEALISAAQAAKQPEVVALLRQNMTEEAETDKRLAQVSKRLIKEFGKQAEAEPQAKSSKSNSSKQKGASAKSSPNGGGQAQKRSAAQGSSGKRSGSSGKSSSRKQSGGNGNGEEHGHSSQTTTDPEEIRRWAEARGGQPACVQGTGGKGDIGLMRLEFPGKPNAKDDKLTPISWEDFFDKFEERGLALVYQEETAEGAQSNFNKLISREGESKPKTRSAG